MGVPLKVSLGTVNFTDFLRVTAEKVSNPGVIVYETYIDTPVLNYNFIIPNLDPENYIIKYYDAPTNPSVGLLRLELIVNALTNEYAYGRLFYYVGAGGVNPVDGSNSFTDPALALGTITGIFKQGESYRDPATEYSINTAGDTVTLTSDIFNLDEKVAVEIKYPVGVASSGNSGIYSGRVDVTASTYTVLAANKSKRHRLVGTTAAQVITLPSLTVLAQDSQFLFDNTCGGVAKQVTILIAGTDRINFNGFSNTITDLTEIWVSKGEVLLLSKIDNKWELVLDYKGTDVAQRFSSQFIGHQNTLPEDGSLYNSNEYPRLAWYIKNILPNTHFFIDDTIENPAWSHPTTGINANKYGQFVFKSDYSKFRMPNTQGLTEKGLKDFDNYGTDTGRLVDYPGGFQAEQVGQFTLPDYLELFAGGVNHYTTTGSGRMRMITKVANTGKKNIVDNVGIIYLRKI